MNTEREVIEKLKNISSPRCVKLRVMNLLRDTDVGD